MDAGALSELTGALAIFFCGMIVLTPILALSTRFALRPLVETFVKLRESHVAGDALNLQARRMELMEAEIQHLHSVVESLSEADEFRRQLAAPPRSPSARA